MDSKQFDSRDEKLSNAQYGSFGPSKFLTQYQNTCFFRRILPLKCTTLKGLRDRSSLNLLRRNKIWFVELNQNYKQFLQPSDFGNTDRNIEKKE